MSIVRMATFRSSGSLTEFLAGRSSVLRSSDEMSGSASSSSSGPAQVGGGGGGGGGASQATVAIPHKIAIVKAPDRTQLAFGATRQAPTAILSQGAQLAQAGQGTVRTLPSTVRLLSPIQSQQHAHRPQTAGQPTNYHVPRGPAAVASLSAPRVSGAPRAPVAAPAAGKPIKCWSTSGAQLRAGAVVYAPRPARPHAIQVTAAPRPTALRPATSQTGTTTTVVTRAVRPINVPSPQRTPPPQTIQTVTAIRTSAPKVVPLVQRNYPAKVVGVALGVRPNIPPRVSGTYYYEVSSSVSSNTTQSQNTGAAAIVSPLALSATLPVHSLPVNIVPPHSTVTSFSTSTCNLAEISRAPTSPVGPQRPSILRKRDNEGSPVKSQWAIVASPPPSPGGSTTVSAASSPELDDEESHLPLVPIPPPPTSLPSFNNCSPRKKPRKQLLNTEARMSRGGDCEFPSEVTRTIIAISPPPAAVPLPAPVQPDTEKTPRRAMLSAAWTCGWRANALHFTRPSDVKKREEKRPTVVELAAQKHVLQKANGWKIHHLTAQMEDLIELETGVLQQATESLKVLESYNQPDLSRICDLLKGNIQRSKIVCEGVAEARTNVLRIFQHKTRVSDILARQADKRCFKKQRNQY